MTRYVTACYFYHTRLSSNRSISAVGRFDRTAHYQCKLALNESVYPSIGRSVRLLSIAPANDVSRDKIDAVCKHTLITAADVKLITHMDSPPALSKIGSPI
ncbi:hypothetical protein BaRGS_00002927 [Batillaria attramentaria]|uniref:Uncharacterized protein n=1 Tax=Batillaria attramentaria TaxID=370345 RepID=A0ABD0M2D5_9CAEN